MAEGKDWKSHLKIYTGIAEQLLSVTRSFLTFQQSVIESSTCRSKELQALSTIRGSGNRESTKTAAAGWGTEGSCFKQGSENSGRRHPCGRTLGYQKQTWKPQTEALKLSFFQRIVTWTNLSTCLSPIFSIKEILTQAL